MNWLRFRFGYYLFSGIFLLFGLIGILRGGLQPALEFTGGSELVVDTDIAQQQVENTIKTIDEADESVSVAGFHWVGQRLTLQLSQLSEEQKNVFVQKINTGIEKPLSEVHFQSVGPAMSQELILKTGYAIVLGVFSILIYLWWQFKDWRFGLAGVLAMLHDSFILLGSFAWLGILLNMKVDLLFVTALLTTLSFSVHDTIVIFDQIRELGQQGNRDASLNTRISQAITQTLPRSLNNSFTIIFMLIALWLLGGESLRSFTVALLIGTITGTYSSTFTAVPLYFDLQKRRQ
jgi:preprotein translocase SecF subunit